MTSPIITLDFDAGTEGAALAAGGDIAAVNGTHTYAAASALHGARGITGTGTSAAPTFTVAKSASFVDANGDWTISLYQRPITVPGGAIQTLVIRNSVNAILGQVRFHSDGKIDVAAGTVRAASSTLTWSANIAHRLDITFAATTRLTTVKIFKGANVEGTSPDETISAVINTQTGGVQNWLFSAARATTAGAQSDLDTIRIYDGIVTPAPFDPPPTGSTATVTHHWLGAPTRTGFKVKAKVSGGASCRLAVSTVIGMTSPTYTGAVVPDADGYAAFDVTSLTAGTRYYYQIEDTPSGGSATLIGVVGRARTLPAANSHSIALAACITTGAADSTALDDIVTWDPDALVFTGDFHYASGTGTTEASQRGQLETQINSAAGLKALLRDVPWGAYTFSDHEAGPDNGDSNNSYTAATIEAYKHIVPYYNLADSRTPTVGRYHSFVIGRVRYIVLDIRNTDRSPGAGTDGAGKTMLGATQKAWLKAELIQAEPVKVIVSDVAWLGPASITNGEDKWWSYAVERQEIADYITANAVKCLLWHGDSHSLAVCTPANNDWGGFGVYCAAPLHNTGGGRNLAEFSAFWNNAGGAVRGYGRIEVVDTGTQIAFTFTGWDAAAGVQRVTQTDTFSLQPAESGTVGLSGSGSLSPIGAPGLVGTASLAGTGTLAGAGEPGLAGAASLAGVGTLAATGRPGLAGAVSLSGAGTLTVTGRPDLAGVASLSGAGALAATGRPHLAATVSLSGAGTLTAATPAATRNITLSIGPGRSRSVTAAGRSRATAATGASRTLTATPRE